MKHVFVKSVILCLLVFFVSITLFGCETNKAESKPFTYEEYKQFESFLNTNSLPNLYIELEIPSIPDYTFESSSSSTSSFNADEIIVYVTNTGSKYHLSGCRYLHSSKTPITLKNAIVQGYDSCSVCF